MPLRLAVLVDGDNMSGSHGIKILQIAEQYGKPILVRVYANAQRPSGWHEAGGYRMIHAGAGKNASDVLLAIDAVELALLGRVDAFQIASSDGDFTHLAHRLREYGATVTGLGEAKAPERFREACSAYVVISPTPAVNLAPEPAPGLSDLDLKIRAIIAVHSRKGAGLRIAALGPKMHTQHGIRISTYPERTWRAYLAARPNLYDLDPRGRDAMVRFRSEGFAAAA